LLEGFFGQFVQINPQHPAFLKQLAVMARHSGIECSRREDGNRPPVIRHLELRQINENFRQEAGVEAAVFLKLHLDKIGVVIPGFGKKEAVKAKRQFFDLDGDEFVTPGFAPVFSDQREERAAILPKKL
jgi:hypothetical protein